MNRRNAFLLLIGVLYWSAPTSALMAQNQPPFLCPPGVEHANPAPVPDTAGRVFLPPMTPDGPVHSQQPTGVSGNTQKTPMQRTPSQQYVPPMGNERQVFPPPDSGVEEELRRRQLQRRARYLKLQMEMRSVIEEQRRRRAMESAKLKSLEEQLAELNKLKSAPEAAEPQPQNPRQEEPKPQPSPESGGDLQWKNADAETLSPEPDESTTAAATPKIDEPKPEAEPQPQSNSEPEPEQLTAEPVEAPTEPAAEQKSLFADAMDATTVIDGPVDRIGLADNLYALGELTIALEMYEQVVTTKIKASEAYWVMFQRACCHRRLGQLEKAQELYRRLAGQEPAGWLAKTSRWWLDQMDTKAAIKATLETQTAAVESMKTTLNSKPDESQIK